MRSVFAAAVFLLLSVSIPSFGGTAETLLPATPGGAAVDPDGAKAGRSPGTAPASTAVPPAMATPGVPGTVPVVLPPAHGVPPDPAPSVPAQNLPVPAAVPSRLPSVPTVSFVAPPSEKAPDRVLSPGEVDLQVTKNLEDVPEEEEGLGEAFFATASKEVAKGKGGVFSGITSPIDKFIRYFQTGGRKRFEQYLSRSGKYVGMMQKILVRYGLPEDLVYVALIESG
ncbi:MAG: hypothetical protein ACXWWV_12260, partial [Candidatus Deferrimicrobiaceae bacterium]